MFRAVDFVLALALLILLMPLFLLIAIAVMIDSPGNPFFLATRVGKGGRPFRMWKFRTMIRGGGGSNVTARKDPRVTRTGKFLRATKLDELPQFINVVLGDMSLVGPRPESPEFTNLYTPAQREVLNVRAGVTGRVQLAMSDESELIPEADADAFYVQHLMDRKIKADLEYLKIRSFGSDLYILLSTAAYVICTLFRAAASSLPAGLRSGIGALGGQWTVPLYLFCTAAAYWLAWLLRFDFQIPASERVLFLPGLAITTAAKLLVALWMGLYLERWWRYQGLADAARLLGMNIAGSLLSTVCIYSFARAEFSRSIYFLDLLVCILLTGGSRFFFRFVRELTTEWMPQPSAKGLLIYGAGAAGIELAREVRLNTSLGYKLIGFLDDDARKHGARLMGRPILGGGEEARRVTEQLKSAKHPVQEIVIAMPSAHPKQRRQALERARAAGVSCRILPGFGDLINGNISLARTRDIQVADLLSRPPVVLNPESAQKALRGKTVMVTGAAGSIGSELCAQLARFDLRRLIAFDVAESQLFALEEGLSGTLGGDRMVIEVGDIRDREHVKSVIDRYEVNTIFHAAAYKHVPMMERQVREAVRNNVLGTWIVAQAAWRGGVSDFVLISTDKAVRPTSIMGLTKRVAELLVSAARPAASGDSTRFLTVRFGNVLLSNGSVVPTFLKQIAAGGPVTVTHPRMERYFTTVQEAVQLILQALTIGRGSDIFLLDMGKPVRIVDLARKMIERAGLRLGEAIELTYTGIRPGERLMEELTLPGETFLATSNPKIRRYEGSVLSYDKIVPWVYALKRLLHNGENAELIRHMAELVPEYEGRAAAAEPHPVERSAFASAELVHRTSAG